MLCRNSRADWLSNPIITIPLIPFQSLHQNLESQCKHTAPVRNRQKSSDLRPIPDQFRLNLRQLTSSESVTV